MFRVPVMTKPNLITFDINQELVFTDDERLPAAVKQQSLSVAQIKTLVLNDFYFNYQILTCYELSTADQSPLLLTPFFFNDEEELKFRLTTAIPLEIFNTLVAPEKAESLLSYNKPDNDLTIHLPQDKIPAPWQKWLGRSYFQDLKEITLSTSYYVDFNSKNKKNINYDLLIAKHPYQKYYLFQGDYTDFYLEVNFQNTPTILTSIILDGDVLGL